MHTVHFYPDRFAKRAHVAKLLLEGSPKSGPSLLLLGGKRMGAVTSHLIDKDSDRVGGAVFGYSDPVIFVFPSLIMGSTSVAVVPCPGADSKSNRPPNAVIRS